MAAAGPRLPFVWQAQYTEPPVRAARWPAAAFRVACRHSTQSFLAAFRVAGAVHRASWTSCGARGNGWPADAFRVTHHTPLITAPLFFCSTAVYALRHCPNLSALSLTRGPAGNRTTTGSLSATQE